MFKNPNPFKLMMSSFRRCLHLGDLSPAPGSNSKKKRVGRGRAHGGRFCGRGAAGQKSRSGPGMPRGITGGQTPLHISTPKYGFTNVHRKDYSLVNLGRIQHLIDTGRIDSSKPITLKSLYDAGIQNLQDGVKILGGGKGFFKSKVLIEATQLSKEAIARIEELGGSAVSIHHTELSLRGLTRPQLFEKKHRIIPRSPPPVHIKDRLYYSDPAHRGYLVEEYWKRCSEADPTFEQRYIKAEPTPLPSPPILLKDFLSKSKFINQLIKGEK